jgi:GNAT superfamily N-acetyltransferase
MSLRMEIEVRQAAPAEAALVSEVLVEAASWLRESGTPLWEPAQIGTAQVAPDVEAGLFFLAWSGADAVGTMRLAATDPLFWPDATPGEALYLHRLAVRRSASGGGTSSALLGWAARHAASRGARYLRLDCETCRPRLRRFYERFGFVFHRERTVGRAVVARYQLACAYPHEDPSR